MLQLSLHQIRKPFYYVLNESNHKSYSIMLQIVHRGKWIMHDNLLFMLGII